VGSATTDFRRCAHGKWAETKFRPPEVTTWIANEESVYSLPVWDLDCAVLDSMLGGLRECDHPHQLAVSRAYSTLRSPLATPSNADC
jgi:hypothetical protein